jgi:two-component system OmpR family response regulator
MESKAIFSGSLGENEKMYHPSLKVHKASGLLKQYSQNSVAAVKPVKQEIKIFLVDDDILFLKALEHSISSKLTSVKIQTFQTGEACLQQMKFKPQIVILDYYLNSKLPYAWNGLTILRQIKKISKHTKVIMLSSQDSLDVAVKCIENGSFDYISKSESAFVKINNVLLNIVEDIKENQRGLKPYQIITLIIILILMLGILLK